MTGVMILILFLTLILLLTNGDNIKWFITSVLNGNVTPVPDTPLSKDLQERIKRINYDMYVANQLKKTEQYDPRFNPEAINKRLARLKAELKALHGKRALPGNLDPSRMSQKSVNRQIIKEYKKDPMYPVSQAVQMDRSDRSDSPATWLDETRDSPTPEQPVNGVESRASSAGSELQSAYSGAIADFESGVGAVSRGAHRVYSGAVGGIEAGAGSVSRGARSLYSGTVGDVEAGAGAVSRGAHRVYSGAVGGIEAGAGAVSRGARSLYSGTVGAIEAGAGAVSRGARSLYSGTVGDIEAGAGTVSRGARNVYRNSSADIESGANTIDTDAYHYGDMANRTVDRWGNDLNTML